jgi:poly-gamma-glutamate synthesis protein (capsule biosynthesis protein)
MARHTADFRSIETPAPRPTSAIGGAAAAAILFAVLGWNVAATSADIRAPVPAMFSDPKPFLEAIRLERRKAVARSRVTGISVPHHILAADMIARGFVAAAGNSYDRIIILSPDHFNRSRRPLATTRRDIDTVFGRLKNDSAATGSLLRADDLFDDADLFDREHGIAALLPFVRRFFPDARIVPVAISYGASREQCDRALALIGKLVGPRTLVVQSTDYSHYLSADVARQRDQETLNIIAANDADAVLRLVQPAHMDSRASQYLQMRLQKERFGSHATVVANRNSVEYGMSAGKTTSYIVTVYSERPAMGAETQYPDQQFVYFGGDIFIGRWLTEPLADKDVADAIVRRIRAATGGAPIVVNLEGVLLNEPPEGLSDELHAMHAGLAVPILKALNVKVAGLANNHSFDLGPAGYEETLSVLGKAGIAALRHKDIIDIGPFRLLGLNFIGKLEQRDLPMINGSELEELCRMKAAPPLIAFVHWGREYTTAADDTEYAAARTMQACGVTALIGAHSHQAAPGIEAIQGGEFELDYSLGNLLFDQKANRASGALIELRAFKQGTYATRVVGIPNLFEFGLEQLRKKRGQPITAPQTSSGGSTKD